MADISELAGQGRRSLWPASKKVQVLPLPSHTVQLPEPLHFSQLYGGSKLPLEPLP